MICIEYGNVPVPLNNCKKCTVILTGNVYQKAQEMLCIVILHIT